MKNLFNWMWVGFRDNPAQVMRRAVEGKGNHRHLFLLLKRLSPNKLAPATWTDSFLNRRNSHQDKTGIFITKYDLEHFSPNSVLWRSSLILHGCCQRTLQHRRPKSQACKRILWSVFFFCCSFPPQCLSLTYKSMRVFFNHLRKQ